MDESAAPAGFLILLAGVLSIELGISTAIIEILFGVFASGILGLRNIHWLDFLSNFGLLGIMFFAGFEIDINILKKYLKNSLS